MRLVVLGSGTSFGVPVLGCDCAVCRSDDPRDRRTRVAALVESADGRRLLIDTPPEVRLQLLRAGVGSVDAVLYTHDHADHVHGIDDLRAMTGRGQTLPVYGSADTLARLAARFPYIFDRAVRPPPGTSKPELVPRVLEPLRDESIAGFSVVPLPVPHGDVEVLGYRVGAVGYVTDAKLVPAECLTRLRGVRVLVLNALFERPHPTHLSIPEAIAVARTVGAERTILTHLTHRQTHALLAARLPVGVEPAYDGLEVVF
ncbi:MAG: MBL fold metallo-hydrolase [Gemmatimonadota bacterium]|nr:MBL fold metallo-hydrolase [Gemmatimonadota bacterium]